MNPWLSVGTVSTTAILSSRWTRTMWVTRKCGDLVAESERQQQMEHPASYSLPPQCIYACFQVFSFLATSPKNPQLKAPKQLLPMSVEHLLFAHEFDGMLLTWLFFAGKTCQNNHNHPQKNIFGHGNIQEPQVLLSVYCSQVLRQRCAAMAPHRRARLWLGILGANRGLGLETGWCFHFPKNRSLVSHTQNKSEYLGRFTFINLHQIWNAFWGDQNWDHNMWTSVEKNMSLVWFSFISLELSNGSHQSYLIDRYLVGNSSNIAIVCHI